MINSIDQTQRNAAKAVGAACLLTNALAYFAEFQVRARLFDYQSAANTFANIVSSENLFRLGLAPLAGNGRHGNRCAQRGL